jgi:hypothetical protein
MPSTIAASLWSSILNHYIDIPDLAGCSVGFFAGRLSVSIVRNVSLADQKIQVLFTL